MSEEMFTPGPWDQEPTGDGKRICIGLGLFDGPNGYDVAEVYSDDVTEETYKEAKANAHLIAAAPDLYEALEVALEQAIGCFQNHYGEDPIGIPEPEYIQKARAALAKARGETP